jgi:hypothetical protein
VPPPAADAVETELRWVGGAFSILGILFMKKKRDTRMEKTERYRRCDLEKRGNG